MNSSLLLEFYSEELPHYIQREYSEKFYPSLIKQIKECFDITECEIYFTPTRLVLFIDKLSEKPISQDGKIRGPKINAPQIALDGFLKKHNLVKEQLTQDALYYYFVNTVIPSGAERLKSVIEDFLQKFRWAESMKWGAYGIRWARPLKNILCIYQNKVLPIKFGHIVANNNTFGHKVLAPQKIVIQNYKQYKEALARAKIMLGANDRKASIVKEINSIISGMKTEGIANYRYHDEIHTLIEYPFVYIEKIPEKFLYIPSQIIETVLRGHQKYVTLYKKDGLIAPFFIIVSNSDSNPDVIKNGNRLVTVARLEDAKYFWELDKKSNIEILASAACDRVFHDKIGTIGDKMKVALDIALQIARKIRYSNEGAIEDVMRLAKADLASETVGEFPELQGILGRYLALDAKINEEISDAIEDHYRPIARSADLMPRSLLSCICAIAEKLSTITLLFGAQIFPTGSKDPYALRRSAISIKRILELSATGLLLEDLHDIVPEDVINFIEKKAA